MTQNNAITWLKVTTFHFRYQSKARSDFVLVNNINLYLARTFSRYCGVLVKCSL